MYGCGSADFDTCSNSGSAKFGGSSVTWSCSTSSVTPLACYAGEAICTAGNYGFATKVDCTSVPTSQQFIGSTDCPKAGGFNGICQNCLSCPSGSTRFGTGDATGYETCKCVSATPTWDPAQTKCVAGSTTACSCPDRPGTGTEYYIPCAPGTVVGSTCEVDAWALRDSMNSNLKGLCSIDPQTCPYP